MTEKVFSMKEIEKDKKKSMFFDTIFVKGMEKKQEEKDLID